ncbi:MAG: alanine racemase [Deltaproteobacteria bacterium]|nr:alanine racemase [Deltaproteobacteria bacterium]MBZ0220666.1 alanine racemase [Deltaproteobacteria bacterium]
MKKRPTSAFIDREALRFNYRQLRSRIPAGTAMMAVVKANAYGHGDIEVARVLEAMGSEFLGVAIPEEGARLRDAGITKPIAVLGGIFPDQAEMAFDYDLTPVVFELRTARSLDSEARKRGAIKKIHVKIDTGMGRLGLLPGEAGQFFAGLKELPNLKVEAVLSHFAESESEDKGFSISQLSVFQRSVEEIRATGFDPLFTEIANSAAIVDLSGSHHNLVRPGIMLYGSYPAERLRERLILKPVLELKTRILHIKGVPKGFSVSYGRRFTTKRPSLIATLPIGYADGLPRRLEGKGAALAGGRRVPLVGAICMDLAMADVTDVPDVKAGDEVVIIGSQGAETITAEEVAGKAGTISYEIFCGISQRVPRVYLS